MTTEEDTADLLGSNFPRVVLSTILSKHGEKKEMYDDKSSH